MEGNREDDREMYSVRSTHNLRDGEIVRVSSSFLPKTDRTGAQYTGPSSVLVGVG